MALRKGAQSLQKRIAEHKEYIENPKVHVPDWDSLPQNRRDGLIRHWNKEIANFKKHGIHFRTAVKVFLDPNKLIRDDEEHPEIELDEKGENNSAICFGVIGSFPASRVTSPE